MSKIQSHHLQKPAYIYVRQSTMGQVRDHQESTERQYDLRNRAVEMMWAPERIRILDQDLGQSGAQTTNREDFKTLVADVSLGRVGAIFALEASRLARSNLEWHRLIEICALTRTLVIDEGVPPVVESRWRQEHITLPSAARQGRHPRHRGAPSASTDVHTR